MSRLIILLVLALGAWPVWAADYLSIDFTRDHRPNFEHVYKITGLNPSKKPEIVIIRIDDQPDLVYQNRVNAERTVLPGPFEILIQPAALQTPSGRFLKLDQVLNLKVFSPAKLYFKKIEPLAQKRIPYAFDFGADHAPVFPGFQQLTTRSAFIKSAHPKAFIRKGADSLIRDGIKGITRFEMPLPNGDWMVHMWSEDIGEWETLPALYERRIRINGKTVQMIRQNHEEWILSRYLIGAEGNGATPWQAFGQRRGGLFQTTVQVNEGMLRLDLAGANAQATTITGLLLEKVGEDYFTPIQKNRQKWFEQRWPYITETQKSKKLPKKIISFGGETLFIETSGETSKIPEDFQGHYYTAKSAFHRTTPNSGLLVKTSKRLSPQIIGQSADYLKLKIPRDMAAGTYQIGELEIIILDGSFPKVDRSIGIYLEAPPHLENVDQINRQIWCDLDYLKQLGLTAIAPPFSKNIANDYQRAQSMGFRDVLAYTPVKRHLDAVTQALKMGKINDLILSIADEPSNPGQDQALARYSRHLQNATPFAKRAGHFNNPRDKKHLEHIDYALINSGYGVDLNDILRLKKLKKTVWFYNMEAPRLAGGFYLWRMGVEGYLQWHGRMPTADPFDPTDGREDDVQLLYPTETVCSSQQDIDHQLIEMINGLSDLRWLLWLDEVAKTNFEARRLKRKITSQIPEYWTGAQKKSDQHWRDLKSKIQELALRLQN